MNCVACGLYSIRLLFKKKEGGVKHEEESQCPEAGLDPCVPQGELPVVLRATGLWPQCQGYPAFQVNQEWLREETPAALVCPALPWRFTVTAALWILRSFGH